MAKIQIIFCHGQLDRIEERINKMPTKEEIIQLFADANRESRETIEAAVAKIAELVEKLRNGITFTPEELESIGAALQAQIVADQKFQDENPTTPLPTAK